MAALDIEGDIADGGVVAVELGKVFDVDHGCQSLVSGVRWERTCGNRAATDRGRSETIGGYVSMSYAGCEGMARSLGRVVSGQWLVVSGRGRCTPSSADGVGEEFLLE